MGTPVPANPPFIYESTPSTVAAIVQFVDLAFKGLDFWQTAVNIDRELTRLKDDIRKQMPKQGGILVVVQMAKGARVPSTYVYNAFIAAIGNSRKDAEMTYAARGPGFEKGTPEGMISDGERYFWYAATLPSPSASGDCLSKGFPAWKESRLAISKEAKAVADIGRTLRDRHKGLETATEELKRDRGTFGKRSAVERKTIDAGREELTRAESKLEEQLTAETNAIKRDTEAFHATETWKYYAEDQSYWPRYFAQFINDPHSSPQIRETATRYLEHFTSTGELLPNFPTPRKDIWEAAVSNNRKHLSEVKDFNSRTASRQKSLEARISSERQKIAAQRQECDVRGDALTSSIAAANAAFAERARQLRDRATRLAPEVQQYSRRRDALCEELTTLRMIDEAIGKCITACESADPANGAKWRLDYQQVLSQPVITPDVISELGLAFDPLCRPVPTLSPLKHRNPFAEPIPGTSNPFAKPIPGTSNPPGSSDR
jgi:hypothetical protein